MASKSAEELFLTNIKAEAKKRVLKRRKIMQVFAKNL